MTRVAAPSPGRSPTNPRMLTMRSSYQSLAIRALHGRFRCVNPPGHLAVAYLLGRRRPGARLPRFAWLACGALVPDALDKSAMLLGLTPYGRTVGHSLVLWASMLTVWMWAAGLRVPAASALGLVTAGGVSHLAADLVDDVVEGVERTGFVFSAWAGWPWTNPDMWSVRVDHLWPYARHATTSLELLTIAMTLGLLARDRARGAA